MASFPGALTTFTPNARANFTPNFAGIATGVFRLPTDPLFVSDITLEGIAIGSRYWIALQSDLSNVLSSGEAASTTEVISAVPCYSNPQLLELRVRKSSGGTKYLPLKTYAYQDRNGAFFYVVQTEDGIAS